MAVTQNLSFRYIDINALKREAKDLNISLSSYSEALIAIALDKLSKLDKEQRTAELAQALLQPPVPKNYKQNS